ncbi:MAG: prepilin-type N-terminal cleavage/methylation domain-containing protein [Patescibacteria group bacterium]
MKYPSTSGRNSGFTLVEVLISMGIMLILFGLTTPFTIRFYRRYQVITERNLLLSLLRQARTQSFAGAGSTDHGVHIASASYTYTLFEGTSYVARDQSKDQVFEMSTNVTMTGPSDILFKYLSARTSSVSLTFDNGTRQEKIYVNKEGRIDWQ